MLVAERNTGYGPSIHQRNRCEDSYSDTISLLDVVLAKSRTPRAKEVYNTSAAEPVSVVEYYLEIVHPNRVGVSEHDRSTT
jgi:hypothetical protein